MKKPVFLLVFSLLLSGALKAQPIDWDAVMDRYVEKYQPEIMPEWLFPIIFKNGTGDRDTIYIGHHPDAHIFGGFPADTIFGEGYFPADTSIFQAYLHQYYCADDSSNCELIKTDVSSDFELRIPILFFHGKLPMRMYFNTALFRSDVLPQYNPPELPQLQGEVWEHTLGVSFGNWNEELEEWDNFCPFDAPVLLTDTSYWGDYCAFSDSTYISDLQGGGNYVYLSWLDFYLKTWSGQWLSTKIPREGNLKIYPNPASNYLHVDLELTRSGEWEIYDYSGRCLTTSQFTSLEVLGIPLTDLENGIYYLRIRHRNNLFVEKFVVLH